jgi:hypothetical protein
MNTDALMKLIELCTASHCTLKLEASHSGIVATVTAFRAHVQLITTVYLDRNDKEIGSKLEAAVQRVQ